MQSDILLIILSVILHFYTYLNYNLIEFLSTHLKKTYLLFKGYLCTNGIRVLTAINVFVRNSQETSALLVSCRCDHETYWTNTR